MIESQPNLDYIITPVGGGGLLSGTILSSKNFSSKTKVIAVEPEGANDAFRSLESGVLVESHTPNTIADGLLTKVGSINWEIIKPGVSEILLVNDKEIMSALELIVQRMKIIVEPSSATVLAAVLKNRVLFKNKNVGLIISGGNFNLLP